MAKTKPYLPNNWDEFKDAPDNYFIPHTFEEVMEWKVAGWELPSSICCIIRVSDIKTGKIKEHVYSQRSAAKAKVNKLISTPGVEFVIADHESIHFLTPSNND